MKVGDAIRSANRLLRARAPAVLPPFLAETAIGVIVQSVGVVAALLAYLTLRGSGRIDRVLDAFGALDVPVTEADVRTVVEAVRGLFTPTVVAILGVASLLILVGFVVGRAVAAALKVHTVRAAFEPGEASPVAAGVAGIRQHTGTFVWFVILQVTLFVGPPLVGLAALATFGVAGGLVFALAMLVWLPVAIAGYFALLFVPEAIVVHDVGVLDGVQRNVDFVLDRPGRALLYVGVEIGLLVATWIVGGVLSVAGVARLAGVLGIVLFAPWLGLVKMGTYLDAVDPGDVDRLVRDPSATGSDDASEVQLSATDPAAEPSAADAPTGTAGGAREPSLTAVLGDTFETGHGALRGFVRRRFDLVVVALAAFAVGGLAGYRLTAPAGLAPDPGGVGFGALPVDTAVQIAANNWLVAVSQTFAGLAAGVPTLINLSFNGLLVGALAGLGFDPRLFFALIAPHGVIEIPALAISGGLGLYLGLRAIGFARGRVDTGAFADDLTEAFYVLVGLLPWFVLAGLVEAFLTPWVGEVVRRAIGG